MRPCVTGAIPGTVCGLGLLLVVRRMPFLRRPPVDERISPYLRDLAGAPAPFTPVESSWPIYAVFRVMTRTGRLPQAERVLR